MRATTKMNVFIAMALLLVVLVMGCAAPSKAELDAEVKRLCAVDGGIKVHETVKLSSEKFNKWGQVNFFRPTEGENALGAEYIYIWHRRSLYGGESSALHSGEISITRDHIQIERRADKKLLGEMVRYSRAGGDLPGPWMPSSYHCPSQTEANGEELMRHIFTK